MPELSGKSWIIILLGVLVCAILQPLLLLVIIYFAVIKSKTILNAAHRDEVTAGPMDYCCACCCANCTVCMMQRELKGNTPELGVLRAKIQEESPFGCIYEV
jgi:hypothetical protein